MSEPPGVRVDVAELPRQHRHGPPAHSLRSFGGWLEGIERTRLTVRGDGGGDDPIPAGTLVEVNTEEEFFLGEVKYSSGGRTYIDFEHQIRKPAKDARLESAVSDVRHL